MTTWSLTMEYYWGFRMVSKSLTISRCILIIVFSFFLSGMAGSPPLVGGPAPAFELETRDGKVISLSDFKGKTIILNFWATWCVPCIKEMPEFNKAYPSLKDRNVEIIAINFGETKGRVDGFVTQHRLKFPVLLDRYANTSQDYRVRSLPVTFFITPDGIIRDEIFGGGITQELIEHKLRQLAHPFHLRKATLQSD